MAKMNKTISFKNAEFRVTKDELTGEKRIVIIEETKGEEREKHEKVSQVLGQTADR